MASPLHLPLQARQITVNRPTLHTLLLLAGLALGGLLLGACGGSDDDADAKAALAKTVSATSKIESGRLTASFALKPDGPIALGGEIQARAAGPFTAPAQGELPTSKLALSGSIGGQSLRATATTTGKRAFLRLGGKDYRLGDDTVTALTEALGRDSGAGFASLGLDPASWITDAETKDGGKVGGVDTTRISGGVDAGKLLADVAKLLDAAGAGGLLTAKLRKQIADSVKSASVDVYSGADDQILRRLVLAVDFAFDDKARSPITGLDGGTIKVDIRIAGVNETTLDVTAPENARPLTELPDGGGLGALLNGLGGALPGGGGGEPDEDSKAFLDCVRKAAGDAEEVGKCAGELTP
jgi:hypothetical protein